MKIHIILIISIATVSCNKFFDEQFEKFTNDVKTNKCSQTISKDIDICGKSESEAMKYAKEDDVKSQCCAAWKVADRWTEKQ